MILIITHKEDFTADFVINKLNDRGIRYYRLNCEDIINEKIVFENQNEFEFDFNLNNFDSIDSIWFRRTKLPELNVSDDSEKLYLLGDYDALLENIYLLLDSKRWLSKPRSVYEAENKIYQLKVAKSVGFNIPNTIVTSDHSILREFISKQNENIIIKPIRQGRIQEPKGFKTIFTNKITANIIDKIEQFDLTPCIFQNYIEKEYELRITVVDNNVFSAKVDSQIQEETKVDWRKKKLPFESYRLPVEIQEKCIEITKKLNLSFGAIDLIKNKQGEYIFLEINPNGQWAWIEMETELNISDAIINFLTI